jgi:hypothetical protein
MALGKTTPYKSVANGQFYAIKNGRGVSFPSICLSVGFTLLLYVHFTPNISINMGFFCPSILPQI